MNDRDRLRRADPPRTEPLRQWSSLYRGPDSWNPRDTPPRDEDDEAPKADRWNDVVSEGVALGYRVIEEQIRQGQRVAEQIGEASYGPAAITGDVREASERMVRYSADLVALWLDFVNTTIGNGDILRALSAAWQPGAAPAPAAEAAAMPIEICSSRPLRAHLELKPGAAGRPLAVPGLHALEADKPPLTAVTFEPAGSEGGACLRIRVPDGQAAGRYAGVVVDQQSGEPVGTLSVRLSG